MDTQNSLTRTFAQVAFYVSTLVFVGSAFEQIGPVHFAKMDATLFLAYLGSVFSLYFGRRWTEARVTPQNPPAP